MQTDFKLCVSNPSFLSLITLLSFILLIYRLYSFSVLLLIHLCPDFCDLDLCYCNIDITDIFPLSCIYFQKLAIPHFQFCPYRASSLLIILFLDSGISLSLQQLQPFHLSIYGPQVSAISFSHVLNLMTQCHCHP